MKKSIGRALFATAALASTLFTTGADAQGARKQLTIIVGSGPGGTMDTNARQIAQYLGRHLPGSPTVVVQNMPGGSGMHATNYIYEVAKPDAQTIYYGIWFPIAQILKTPELKAQYDKMGIIGAGADTRGIVVRRDVTPRIDKAADIMKVQNLVVGGTSLNGAQDILNRMSLDLLGVKYKMVTGYGNGAESFLAIVRGEIDVLNNSYATIVRRSGPEIKAGKLMPGYYFCTMDDKGNVQRADFIKDTPCLIDLYKEVHGKLPSGDLFDTLNFYTNMVANMIYILATPPGVSEENLKQLREAYAKAVAEPEFIDFYVKATGFGPELATLDDAKRIMGLVGTVRPHEVATLRQYYETGK